MTAALHPGFRLGIFMFKDAEILDFAAPYGVFSVARRFDPALDVFFVAESLRPVQAQAGFTVLPNSAFADRPALDAFLIPGGFGTRQEMYNGRLHEYIRSLPASCLLTSVCTGSWVYGQMGLLDGLSATNRKEPDRLEASDLGKVPIHRLAEIAPACRISAGPGGRRWPHHHRRRDRLGHGAGLPPAAPGRLQRNRPRRGRPGDGVPRGLSAVQGRPGDPGGLTADRSNALIRDLRANGQQRLQRELQLDLLAHALELEEGPVHSPSTPTAPVDLSRVSAGGRFSRADRGARAAGLTNR